MAAKIKSDTKELDEILANFQKFTNITVPLLVRRHARLLAVELANRTQPFSVGKGVGKSAQNLGKNAVENDNSKVFRSQTDLGIDIVDKTQNEKLKERLRKYVYAGEYKKFGEVLKKVGMMDEYQLLSKSAFPSKHKAHRSPASGRTWSPKKSMYIATSGLLTYVKEIQKRVGYSKSAWADCARKIGGINGDHERGIPSFAKSNKHKSASGTIIDGTKSSNPFINITSHIPWASRILRESEIKFAQQIVRDKMVKQANYMTKHAAKKNFNPTPEDE